MDVPAPRAPHTHTHTPHVSQALTDPEVPGLKVTVGHLVGGLQAAQEEGQDVLHFLALNLGEHPALAL